MRNARRRALLVAAVLVLAAIAVVLRTSRRARPTAPRSPPDDSRRVVLVSIDGLRAEYVTHADAFGLRIPSLRALLAAGTGAEVESVWPSVTYPAHATLVTGVRPSRHGIATNMPLDPAGTLGGAWWFYARDLHATTLWDAVHAAGGTTGAIYWPVTVGARIDFLLPQIWRTKDARDDAMLRELATPGLAKEVEDRYGALPAEHRTDEERANAAELVIAEKHPTLTLVYFTDLDTVQHHAGPFSGEALAMLERIDELVGRVVRATELAGTRPRTTFVIASDHGFLPVHAVVRPAILLASAGLLDLDARGLATSWRAAPLPAGGTCGIVLEKPDDDALRAKVADVLARAATDPENGIERVHPGDEIAREGGFPGSAFVLEARSGFEFKLGGVGPVVIPALEKGAHGYPPSRPEMRVFAIFSGDGIRKAPPLPRVRLVDVAPTIANLLAAPLPDAEGRVLDEVLVSK